MQCTQTNLLVPSRLSVNFGQHLFFLKQMTSSRVYSKISNKKPGKNISFIHSKHHSLSSTKKTLEYYENRLIFFWSLGDLMRFMSSWLIINSRRLFQKHRRTKNICVIMRINKVFKGLIKGFLETKQGHFFY